MSIADPLDIATRERREPPARTPNPADRDLSFHVAGAAARERARELRAAAPVRTALARAFGVKTQERTWRITADGEEAVATELIKLGPSWRILHGVPIGGPGSDIDHLAIGPAGVFTISTKHNPDANIWVNGETFKVNGVNQHYVRNARIQAAHCGKVLTAHTGVPVGVKSMIAVMGAGHGFIIKAQPADGLVRVVSRRALARELSDLPWVLDASRIHAIHELARRGSTWRSAPEQWTTASLTAE